jgi:hypothetical protein
MAVPVIENYTEQSETNPSTTITVSKPVGVQSGELMLVILVNDDTSAGEVFNDKAGWIKHIDVGDTTSDSHIGVFSRIADGAEGDPEEFTQVGSDEWVAWWARISGVNTADPINVVGAANTGSGNSIIAPAVTTTVADCLALCFGAFDGGDGYPFTVSGTGWGKEDDGQSGTSGYSDASGVWGKKTMAGAGSTLDATIGASGSDGIVGVQLAIAPGGAPPAYYHGLTVQGVGELALCDAGAHPLRIRKGGVTYGIELVDPADINASAVRIQTPTGVKALRKYT